MIETAGQDLGSMGGLLGTLLSVVGASLLTGGILNHRGQTRREQAMIAEDDLASGDR